MSDDAGRESVGPGGYDAFYRQCPCFWGTAPGRLVAWLVEQFDVTGRTVLDLGCGEGKNAALLAEKGCIVEAWDISGAALSNAKRAWPEAKVRWKEENALALANDMREFDIIIAYGLLHCLPRGSIQSMIIDMQRATSYGGFNIVVCFNIRLQDMRLAHPGFAPSLLPHSFYVSAYHGWNILYATDENLHETHPPNLMPHTHSMTRLLAQKRGED